jgi:DNA-damage-inducible protein J
MPTQSSMLHVRIDDQLKSRAAAALADVGLTLSDAVRILLTRIVAEGGLPAGLTADPDAYDTWFRAKVQQALDDPRPPVPHADVMADVKALIDSKRLAHS